MFIWVIAIDETSGMHRMEFYENNELKENITGPGPIYEWQFFFDGSYDIFIKVEGYDIAGNSIYEVVYIESRICIQQSIHPLFLRLLERFPLLERLLSFIK